MPLCARSVINFFVELLAGSGPDRGYSGSKAKTRDGLRPKEHMEPGGGRQSLQADVLLA